MTLMLYPKSHETMHVSIVWGTKQNLKPWKSSFPHRFQNPEMINFIVSFNVTDKDTTHLNNQKNEWDFSVNLEISDYSGKEDYTTYL